MCPGIVRNVGLGAGAQQHIDHGRVVEVRGPVKRGGAVALTRVDVDALL